MDSKEDETIKKILGPGSRVEDSKCHNCRSIWLHLKEQQETGKSSSGKLELKPRL